MCDAELPGMWEAADLAGGWADTESACEPFVCRPELQAFCSPECEERHRRLREAERLTRPHRDRKWPKGETPSLFAGMTGHEGEE